MTDRKLISIVIPVFNESETILRCYETVTRIIRPLEDRYGFELVFTDNHSKDGTFDKIKALSARDSRVRGFRFSKNFGYQKSILTGYLQARGDAAIQLDCDLQDPPEMISTFLAAWEEGYQVVYGVRESRQENWVINRARSVFYRLIDLLSTEPLPVDAGDFRLVDRQILNELAKIKDATPYLRGIIAALGFKQKGISYARNARLEGTSKFSLWNYISLAVDGIVSHSILPLRLATYVGLSTTFLTLIGIAVYALGRFFNSSWPAGFTTLAVLILFSISLNGIFLGIIGEYLARIYLEVKSRPITVIAEITGN